MSETRGAGVGLCQKGPNNILAPVSETHPKGGREWGTGEGGGGAGCK